MPETHLDKFKKLLAELFMFDQADLDFGIYRIMNAKRDEIIRFLDRDLLPQVREALGELEQADRAGVEAELTKAIEQAKSLGADTETLPKVKELRRQLGQKADVEALESEVFSDLYNFFRRYYSEGDFLSLRRYKEGVYAIPYEGEEVKLHWANADQYYIKTTEYFRDYTFKVPDGRRVHFKIAEADTEQNNNKPANGQERRFVLRDEEPVAEEDGELVVRFEYRSDLEKRKQADLNVLAVDKILNAVEARAWLVGIATKAPTDRNPERTLLDKHLSDYTARNTFDYFIHKDLGGFLRREIDFYIKNEVMHLDDIESETASRVEEYLAKVRAIRRIAHKIIDFVAQFENFQKKLWLKKKFVVETNYFITLDRVPEELYPEIASNDSQREEWVRLFAINELSSDMTRPGYSTPLTVGFLKANSNLLLDTHFFPMDFTARLLSGIDNLDAACDGLLIQSENFQGLNLLASRLRNSVQYVYIDPPFNTDSAPILYKNDYRDSSWISLVRDRLELAQRMLVKRAVTTVAIDDTELPNLSKLIEHLFTDARVTRVTVVHNPKGSITKDFNRVHEYAVFVTPEGEKSVIARSLEENETPRKLRRWGENSLRSDRPQSFYPIYVKDGKIARIGVVAGSDIHPSGKNVRVASGEIEIWPIDQDGVERRWNFGLDSIEENLDRIIIQEADGLLDLFLTHEVTVSKTVWSGGKYDAGKYGNTLLIDMLGKKLFDFPKSVHLVKDCVYLATSKEKESIVLDFFGGSGTTGHAVLMLNREDSCSAPC